MSFAAAELLPVFEGGSRFQIIDTAKRFDGNIEPVGDIPLGVAFFNDVVIVVTELGLNLAVVRNRFLHGEFGHAFPQGPVREIDYCGGVNIDFAVADLKMKVSGR